MLSTSTNSGWRGGPIFACLYKYKPLAQRETILHGNLEHHYIIKLVPTTIVTRVALYGSGRLGWLHANRLSPFCTCLEIRG